MKLHGCVSWITGAAGGIGQASSLVLAKAGSRIVISDKDGAGINELGMELEKRGVDVLTLPLDVSDQQAVELACQEIKEKFGRLDILVNGAGISPKGSTGRVPVEKMEVGEWLRVLDVNLNGTFYCSKAAIGLMKLNGAGNIINITSLAGKKYSSITGAHYCASKAAMIALTRQLAGELGSDGIRVNAIAPGRIDTNMIWDVEPSINEQIAINTPLKRLGSPEEVAEAVLFLATRSSSFITGTTIDVNGGMSMD